MTAQAPSAFAPTLPAAGAARISSSPPAHAAHLAPTMVAPPSSPPSSEIPISASPSTTLPRTTVLPRLDRSGPAPQWVLGGQPRYRTERTLGAGGVGEVLLAHDQDIDRKVALKRLQSGLSSSEALLRFADEVRTVGGLEHPSIVPVHDVGMDEDQRHYFVMKYVEGETLAEVIEKLASGAPGYAARYPMERRIALALEVMHAVAYAHERGIIHRDIKPSNIMVGRHGEVWLMDWGVAKRVRAPELPCAGVDPKAPGSTADRAAATRVDSLVGTPAYMSPEQARGENEALDERTDVYSLAVTFHELFTLRHCHAERATVDAVLEAVRGPEHVWQELFPAGAECPAEVRYFLHKGLQKDAGARYQTVGAMLEDVYRIQAGTFDVRCMHTMMKRTAFGMLRMTDRRPMVMAGMMVMSAVGTFGGVAWVVSKVLGF